MLTYTEPARTLPIGGDYDVIVVGSGPSGMAAALTAARCGAHTLLIESQGSVGGISTTGMMSHFAGTADSRLYREILSRSAAKNPQPREDFPTAIDPELLKITYSEMLEEAGVTLLLYTLCCGVMLERDTVRGVITESKSGRVAYTARVTVDCTGDGDVACRAGAAYTLGRETDGKMQPATLMFKVGGVDEERAVFPGSFETTVETEKGELQALARTLLPYPAGHVLLYRSTHPGVVTCNMTNCTDVDGTRVEDLTRAEMVCRRQMEPIVRFLREYVPGYEQCYLISAASLMGIRETRHFHGLYCLTEQDILEARQFEDAVVRGAHFNFDVHNLTGAGLDATGCQHRFTQPGGYTIPYGCLIPKHREGLLLSGRNISGTHMAHSNFRVMPICIAIGEACGAAAALAARRQLRLREVSPAEICKQLF